MVDILLFLHVVSVLNVLYTHSRQPEIRATDRVPLVCTLPPFLYLCPVLLIVLVNLIPFRFLLLSLLTPVISRGGRTPGCDGVLV